MVKICFVSTVYKESDILERFAAHLAAKIDDDAVCLIYCHDVGTYKVSRRLRYKNIVFIQGCENVFYTEAINILLSVGLTDYLAEQFCILDSDCFISDNFIDIMKLNIEKAGIFQNIDINTNKTLPAGFVIKNKFTGRAIDAEALSGSNQNLDIDYSNGRGLFFPAHIVRKIGGLNESFEIYGSDNEYSHRLSKHIGLQYHKTAKVFSYKEETGDNVLVKNISLRKRLTSLWSVRSSSNLRTRVLFCWHVAPNKILFVFWAIRTCANAIVINIFGRWILRFTKFK